MSEPGTTTLEGFKNQSEYREYPTYKDPEIDWLERIPDHWSVNKTKRVGQIESGSGFPKGEQGEKEEEIPFYKVDDMNREGNEKYMNSAENYVSKEISKELGAEIFEEGNIIFPKVGAALLTNKRRILSQKSCIDNNIMAFLPKEGCIEFWYYFLSSIDLSEIANYGAVPSLNERQFKELIVVQPPTEEQEVIANFLDREVKEINNLIKQKENLIELIREQRESLITKLTTKGVRENAPTEKTNNEIIGELPENWEESKLGHITSKLTNGYVGPTRDILTESGIPYIQSTHINNGEIEFDDEFFVSEEWSENHYTSKLKKGDVLLVQTGDVGESAVVREGLDGANCHALIIARPVEKVNSHYLNLFLESKVGKKLLQRTQTGATLKHLNTTRIKDITIPIPPQEEQKKIVERLESKGKEFDSMVSQIETGISLLEELRNVLITEAVTGQIDIRGEV